MIYLLKCLVTAIFIHTLYSIDASGMKNLDLTWDQQDLPGVIHQRVQVCITIDGHQHYRDDSHTNTYVQPPQPIKANTLCVITGVIPHHLPPASDGVVKVSGMIPFSTDANDTLYVRRTIMNTLEFHK